MLGAAADRFMLNQMSERVVAHSSNAHGQSMQVPDRERPGTAHVMMKAGQMPGPQNQLSSDWMPGMGFVAEPAAPPSSALPGMSGLGDVTVSTGTLMGLGAILAGLVYFMHKK